MSVEFQGIKIVDAILVFKNKGGLRFLILFFLISKKNLGGFVEEDGFSKNLNVVSKARACIIF
jgi:hypothetical protein